jgi:hypothetical protein
MNCNLPGVIAVFKWVADLAAMLTPERHVQDVWLLNYRLLIIQAYSLSPRYSARRAANAAVRVPSSR